jgi:hypothetical protein
VTGHTDGFAGLPYHLQPSNLPSERVYDRCGFCGERYFNFGAHMEACRGKPPAAPGEAVQARKGTG